MNQNKKRTLIVSAILVSAILVMTVVLSSTLAKFVAGGAADTSARVAKWGITFNSGSDLSDSYGEKETEDKEKIKIVQSASVDDKVVVPGTKGSLAWISVKGKPEAKYDIDITCEKITDEGGKLLSKGFSLGKGFFESERLVHDEKMLPVDYFPIVIRLCVFDFVAKTETYHIYAVQRDDIVLNECYNYRTDVTNLVADGSDYTGFVIDEENVSVEYHLASDVNTLVNDINTGLEGLLDSQNNAPGTELNRIYSVEWDWIYQPVSEIQNSNGETVKLNTYQTDFMDVSLCEAIANSTDKSLFDISLKLGMTVSQSE